MPFPLSFVERALGSPRSECARGTHWLEPVTRCVSPSADCNPPPPDTGPCGLTVPAESWVLPKFTWRIQSLRVLAYAAGASGRRSGQGHSVLKNGVSLLTGRGQSWVALFPQCEEDTVRRHRLRPGRELSPEPGRAGACSLTSSFQKCEK